MGLVHEFPLSDSGDVVVRILSDVNGSWGGTCGASLWAASTAAFPWIIATEERRCLFKDCAVLELGAGLGLFGIALSKAGAARATLTDLPLQLPLLQHNISSNLDRRSGCTVEARALEWGTPLPAWAASQRWDLIVGLRSPRNRCARPEAGCREVSLSA